MANEVTFGSVEGEMGHDYLIYAEAALNARYAHDNVRDLVRMVDISGLKTDQIRFPKRPAVSASALTDGTDLTANTAYTPTQAPATVAEVGLKFTITDLGASGTYITAGELAEAGGMAVLEKISTDVCALGSGLSQTAGATGVDLSETNFEDALITLMGNKAPGEVFAVLHPRQWFDLVNSIGSVMPADGPGSMSPRGVTNDLIPSGNGMGGPVYGADVRVNPLVPTANAGADRAGFIGIKGRTLGGAMKWFIRPEFERDASLRGTEAVVTACYAVIEVEDETGVGIVTDA